MIQKKNEYKIELDHFDLSNEFAHNKKLFDNENNDSILLKTSNMKSEISSDKK